MFTSLNRIAQQFGLKPHPAAAQKKSVLVAEDDEAARNYIGLILDSLGLDVVLVANGPEAIAKLNERKEHPVDLLVTDLMMPAMSGKELAERLWRLFPMQKVLFFSGYPEKMARRVWKLHRDIEFLQKPFSSHDLANKVREMLDAPDPQPHQFSTENGRPPQVRVLSEPSPTLAVQSR